MTEHIPIFEVRGWKNICALIGVKDRATAKGVLKRLGIFCRDGGKPVLSVQVYQEAVAARVEHKVEGRPTVYKKR